ncbi:MAG: type II secretion system protein [Candidatus Cloacimonetes bacterium]|nr:type II secretion system protein [Candidatus Cloacimonadota bacterium]
MRRNDARGLTLVEIIIAVGILSLVLTTVIPHIGVSMKMTKKARSLVTASQLSRNLIHEIQLLKKIEEGKEDGKFEDFEDFSYEYEISKVKMVEVFGQEFFAEKNTGATDLYLDRLYRIEMRVLWDNHGDTEVYETYSLLFREDG